MTTRIVLVTSQFPQLSETFIVLKVLGLRGLGWDVCVACSRFSKQGLLFFPTFNQSQGMRSGIHVQWAHKPAWIVPFLFPFAVLIAFLQAPVLSTRYFRRGLKRFGLGVVKRFYLDAHIVACKPDLIHFEFGALTVDRTYLKDLLDVKVTASFRGYDINFVGAENPHFYEQVWRDTDGLHFLGEDLWLRAIYRGCPPDKPHVLIPPAIDPGFFKPEEVNEPSEIIGTSSRPLRILSVGRLEWKKGYEFGLEAVQRLESEGVACEYRIIGDGEYFEAIVFAVHQMGLAASVRLLGAQSPAVVREQMTWADVFLHSAVTEGFCNAVIEAQAMRLPVVTSDAGGLGENVVDGKTGYVVPRRNPKALAAQLANLARDPALRTTMGEAGRRRVESTFSLPVQIEAFRQFYEEIIGENE